MGANKNPLPDGWDSASFELLYRNVTSSKLKLKQKHYNTTGKYPVVDQGQGMIGGFTDEIELLHPSPPPLIVFGDHTRCVKFVDFKFVQGADGVKVFAPHQEMDPKFTFFLLKTASLPDKGYSRHFKFLRELTFPVPPLNEQKRIVAKIEGLLAHSSRAREVLDPIPDLLEQLRQSILAATFRGHLTKKWREQHPDVEPASEVLKRIHVERRKRWEESELEKLKAKGLSGDKLDAAFAQRRKQYKEPAPVDVTDLPELPESWCWAGLEELSEWVTDGTHQPPPFTEQGIPFLVISNMVGGRIEWNGVQKWVSPKTYDTYTGMYKPTTGDIIYSTVGSYGVAVEVVTDKRFMFQRHIAHIRPLSDLLSITFLTFALNSPVSKMQADKSAKGVAQKTVNLSDLRRFAIPLAPLNEQKEIVGLLLPTLQRVDDQWKTLKLSLAELDTLDQSILTTAFRGELVPQDPNDEPASVLLERIREEKARVAAAQKTKPKARGRKMRPKKDKQKDVLTILREGDRAMTPEEVFAACGFDEESVDAFYEQLRKAVVSNQVREIRKFDWIELEAMDK